IMFFFSSRRRHTRSKRDWSSDVCSSDFLDRNGELLAGEGKGWQVGLHPAQLEEGEGKEENLKTIVERFDTSVEQLEQLLSAEWVTDESFVPFTTVNEGETPELPGVVYKKS